MSKNPIDKRKRTFNLPIISRSMGVVAILVGSLVLLGWVLDVGILKSLRPEWISMKANTALCFVWAGLSLCLLSAPPTSSNRVPHVLARVFAFLVAFIGLLTLSEYVFGWNLRIDQLLFKEELHAIGTTYPGRMSPITAFNFSILGIALSVLNSKRFIWLAQCLSAITALNSAFAILGYFLGVGTTFYGILTYTKMALHTSITFLLLSAGIFAARPRDGLMSIFAETRGEDGTSTGKNVGMVISVTLIVSLILLGVVGLSSLWGVHSFLQSAELRRHTQEVLIKLAHAQSSALDIERKQRGYLLTQNPDYLQDFHDSGKQILEDLEKIQQLTVNNPNHQSQLNTLRALLDERIAMLTNRIKQRDAEGLEASIEVIKSDEGGIVMIEIEKVINEMESEEEASLKEDNRRVMFQADVQSNIIAFGSLLSFLIVGLAGAYIRRGLVLQKLSENFIRESNLRLEAANKELEAFSYSVSHDLRAPLRHIDGFVDLLQKNSTSSLDDKSRRYLNTIADSAKQMGLLIDDLLVFSRMGRVEMQKTTLNMEPLVKEAIEKLAHDAKGRKVNWKTGSFPQIHGDPAMFRQVFINLLGNALKYSRNQPTTQIEIGCTEKENEVVFFVKDNGVGFDMLYADKLFCVFQRLHSSDEFEGTGIGLANVRRIIQRHGGKTWAEGAVDGGATFYFSMPT